MIAKEGAKRVGKDTLVVVAPTDIRKLYARRMPYQSTVRDGSKGEYQSIKGPERVSWKMECAKRHLEVEIPIGVKARVQPQSDDDWVEVGEGKHIWQASAR